MGANIAPRPDPGGPYSVHRPARNMGDAIRLFCRECMGAHLAGLDSRGETIPNHPAYEEVRRCPAEHACSLWRYRLGIDPKKSQTRRDRTARTSVEGAQ
jgi:hypothetical protein